MAAFTLKELAVLARAELRGDPARVVEAVATLQDAGPGTISFFTNPRYRSQLRETRASAVILAADDAADCPVACLVSENPYLSHARVMAAFHPEAAPLPGIHPTACVDASARVAESAEIAANCYIGPGVVVEDHACIGPGCVLLSLSLIHI